MLGQYSKSRSFFQTQLITVIGINIFSLAIVSGLLYSNIVDDYKDNLIHEMRSKMMLLADNSRSALLLQDNNAAAQVLNSLDVYPATRFAQIFDAEGNLFTEFTRQGEAVDAKLSDLESGPFFARGNIYLSQEIAMDNERIGFLLISADTAALKEKQFRYASTVAAAFLVSLILAYILNWRMQKVLTAPLRQLVDLIGQVAEKREYGKRLEVTKNDEIGILSLGVNSMLDTIQDHEKQLQKNGQRLESLVQQLFDRAHYDALTKLPNRHLLTDRLSHSIETAKRADTQMALLFLDLDRFKVINDSLGHPMGDKVLVSVANILTKIVRKADSICRWGGDEFVVVLENVKHKDEIHIVARKIINQLSTPIDIDGQQLHVSTCIGIATYPEAGEDAVTLLKHADISMYKAKARGLGHYCFFEDDMLTDSESRLSMETNVRQSLEQEELFLNYQPQMAVKDGSLDGLEALIRWRRNGELISPETFIPVIEELGLMRQFSLWVLGQACAQNKQWQLEGLPPTRVAVNLPVSFIMHPQCIPDIRTVLSDTGLSPQYLELEITENSFMSSTSYAVDVLKGLSSMGIRISIDDFGTGYSCMSYLRDLPISSLKIDGSFVQGLGLSQANDGIVQSIITLGRSLNMVLVAEGVETVEQLEALTAMQCDIIQGYYFSRPLSVEDTRAYLVRRSKLSQ
ncbi:MAG: diguanylate cyclase (GGDEF)-like protein [Halioglobus sp.]|jgi:diguanylate cyclase (GGDEF)-like protein